MLWWLALQLLLAGAGQEVHGESQIAGLSDECYVRSGDVLLGLLFRMTQPDEARPAECAPISRGTYYMQRLEAVMFGIQRVNQDQNLLPNLTLGFVVFDTCGLYRMNLGRAT